MKTLLLCGYRAIDEHEVALGVERDSSGETLIDRRIHELQALGLEVICILAGSAADEQLRHCRKIPDSELVFDTNDSTSLISNARAGIFAAPQEACFVLPVEVPPPPKNIWNFLHNEYCKVGFATPSSLLQLIGTEPEAPTHFGFPLLLTREGAKQLQNAPELRSFVDPRLKYLHLTYQPLAPAGFPL